MDQKNPNLSDDQKAVLFDKATEVPFTGKFLHNKEKGMYTCANCGTPDPGSACEIDN